GWSHAGKNSLRISRDLAAMPTSSPVVPSTPEACPLDAEHDEKAHLQEQGSPSNGTWARPVQKQEDPRSTKPHSNVAFQLGNAADGHRRGVRGVAAHLLALATAECHVVHLKNHE